MEAEKEPRERMLEEAAATAVPEDSDHEAASPPYGREDTPPLEDQADTDEQPQTVKVDQVQEDDHHNSDREEQDDSAAEEEEDEHPEAEDAEEDEGDEEETGHALSDVHEDDEVSLAKESVVDSLATTATVFRKVNNIPARHTMVGTLSLLYAIFLTALGVVFPLAFFLTGRLKETGLCFAFLHIYVTLTSIILIIYLCIAIWRYKRKDRTNQYEKVDDDQTDRKLSEVGENGYVGGQDQSPSPLLVQESPRVKEDTEDGAADGMWKVERGEGSSKPLFLVAQTEHGVNCLLRLGLIAFGMGSMMLDGFRLVEFVDHGGSMQCIGLLFFIFTSLRLLFTFVQTFFLFKNHRIGLNFHKSVSRFAVLHLVATNLCMWAMTVIMESGNTYARHEHEHRTARLDVNDTTSNNETNNGLAMDWLFNDMPPLECYQRKSLATEASPYLFPCGIEYSLLAVAILCRVYSNIGRLTSREEVLYSRFPPDDKPKSALECQKANTGLFLGLFLFTLICITMLFFLLFETGVNPITETITALVYFGSDITVSVVSLIALAPAFAMMRKLHFSVGVSEVFNQNLMFVSAAGYYLLLGLMVLPALMSIYAGGTRGTLSELQAIACILGFIQSTVQIVFIFDGLRRRSMTRTNFRSKPGRSLVTFLLICNVCMWVIYTFELKEAITAELFAEFYGSLAWLIIMHVGLPLGIFFRFHSSVCLSDIWVNAYKRQHVVMSSPRSQEKKDEYT